MYLAEKQKSQTSACHRCSSVHLILTNCNSVARIQHLHTMSTAIRLTSTAIKATTMPSATETAATSTDDAAAAASRMKLDNPTDFPNLDSSDPVQARRIQQRRRMILLGKNTAGYEEYIKQVPKHKRRIRSMKHPATPDHQKDIPNKRWTGLVKAW